MQKKYFALFEFDVALHSCRQGTTGTERDRRGLTDGRTPKGRVAGRAKLRGEGGNKAPLATRPPPDSELERGFGSFRIRQRNARVGRNPKSGQKVEVPSKKVPFFKAGKELRELVDEHEKAQEEVKS